MEDKIDDLKAKFYEFAKYNIKMLLGGLCAKVGKTFSSNIGTWSFRFVVGRRADDLAMYKKLLSRSHRMQSGRNF
jgi:hypothetical protein